ncbi:hypothetical protein [Actinopolymorpha alba]|uniref:hypothetical protein n=1 Tax=Actinopolymorpha alba TaxID=533267 RepID=UPI00036F9C37|nr:hypothetical protein [Actinopolymorpha alba]
MYSIIRYGAAAITSLTGPGWFHAEGALTREWVDDLEQSHPESWHPLQEDEGGIRQFGFGAYLPMAECSNAVVNVATKLVSQLSSSAETMGFPSIPFFNEVTWTRYPEGKGHITAHRDPPGAGGVIAVFTLEGRATFRVEDGSHSGEWPVVSGDLVILRGRGWPTPDAMCPVHAVDPPMGRSRMIMTMRFNVGGAGAPYFS